MLDSCFGAQALSVLDLKVGYHNLSCTERAKRALGIVTQDGLYRWVRMPFGP